MPSCHVGSLPPGLFFSQLKALRSLHHQYHPKDQREPSSPEGIEAASLTPWNIQKLSKTPRANNICIFESMIFQILKKTWKVGDIMFSPFFGGRTSSFWWRSDTLDCKPFWKLHTKGPISFVDFLFFLWVRMWSRNLSKNRIQKKTYLFLVPETTVF